MTEPNPPVRGSDDVYCSVLADHKHYYASTSIPALRGVWLQRCLSCQHINGADLAAQVKERERKLIERAAERIRAEVLQMLKESL